MAQRRKRSKNVIKRYPVESIDHALRIWEDYHFTTRMQIVILSLGLLDMSQGGPTTFGDEFRQFLLEAREETEFDGIRFGTRKSHVDGLASGDGNSQQGATHVLNQQLQAQAIYRWSRHSRRVYHLSQDLEYLLRMTSLHTMTWGEILWPFESFAITLSQPLKLRDFELDCFIVHPSEGVGEQGFWITCLDRQVRNWPGLGSQRRKAIQRAIATGKWKWLRKQVSRDSRKVCKQHLHAIHLPVGWGKDKIVRSGRKYAEYEQSHGNETFAPNEVDPIYRLVGGFCQYLASLDSGQKKAENITSIVRTTSMDPKCIIAEADVATVANCYSMTPRLRELIDLIRVGASGYELSAHFRRGHWRRPMGLGQVPEAKKTVLVRPTVVRIDRVPNGALPGGSIQMIELQD